MQSQSPQDPVGRPVVHHSAIKHSTGEAVYIDDLPSLDGELFLAAVTSSRAYAKIVSIDNSEALKGAGVFDVITAHDVPAANDCYFSEDPEIIFARNKVMCVGQIVCAVVADSDVHAKQAAAKVKIEYEMLEPEAIKHNLFFEPKRKLELGNVDEAFETVDNIIEGEICFGGQKQFYMETRSMLAIPKGEDKEMDVYVSTQHPAIIQMVAASLGVPANRIMCHVKRVGGSFRGKILKTALVAAKKGTATNEFNKQNYWKKRGIAIAPMKYPFGLGTSYLSQAAALVHISTDGSVLLTHGGIKMGQGIHTKMIQVASRELNIPMSCIYFCEMSTTTVPNACALVGSAGTDANGMAVKDACQTLQKCLQPVIKKNLMGTWNDWIKEAFKLSVSLAATGYFRGYNEYMDLEKGEGQPFTYFLFGAACSEVEINCLTGDHKNLRTDIVMDIGCSINPAVDIGQIEGAFVQGMGLYTVEELKYSSEGALYTRGPDQYKIPAVCDIPEQFSVSLLSSSQNPYAIYASKGIGEAGLFLGCSVFFTLRDAVTGERSERGLKKRFTLNSPLTAEQVRASCIEAFTEMVIEGGGKVSNYGWVVVFTDFGTLEW